MNGCKNCDKALVQSKYGRAREYCSRHCKYAYHRRISKQVEGQATLPLSNYDLPWHLMHQEGPSLILPAPTPR